MVTIFYLQSDPSGHEALQVISDRVEHMCGLVPKTRHIYIEGLYKEMLSGEEQPDFILVDNFFLCVEDWDVGGIPEIRKKFPDAIIVAKSVFEIKDKSLYDLVIGIDDDGKSLDFFCDQVAKKLTA